MTTRSAFLVVALALLIPAFLLAQGRVKPQGHGEGLDPDEVLRPLSESWPTYSGDYSGKRFSALTQINQSNVKNLSLAWVSRVTAGAGAGITAPPGTPGVPSLIVGGEGSG